MQDFTIVLINWAADGQTSVLHAQGVGPSDAKDQAIADYINDNSAVPENALEALAIFQGQHHDVHVPTTFKSLGQAAATVVDQAREKMEGDHG